MNLLEIYSNISSVLPAPTEINSNFFVFNANIMFDIVFTQSTIHYHKNYYCHLRN